MELKHTTCLFVTLMLLLGATTSADETQTNEDVRVAVQQICPVSGQQLGAHGAPIKAKIGKLETFLCCEGCIGKDVKREYWLTIHKNQATAQGKCLVMDENDLPKKPVWTIVNGRLIYVCCPPCIEKIDADPRAFTKKLDARYSDWVKENQTR